MVKIVVINGSAESGKDKFIKFIQEKCSRDIMAFNESSIDPPKKAMAALGMDPKDKSEKNRQIMVDLKQFWIEKTDGLGPINYIKGLHKFYESQYEAFSGLKILFIHCREPDEIQKIVDEFGDNCETLLIKSHRGKAFKNGSDDVVENFNYNNVFENDKGLEHLESLALEFLEYIKRK